MRKMLEIYNDYIDRHIYENQIYEMSEIDELVSYTSVRELLEVLSDDFNIDEEYFSSDIDCIVSLNESEAIEMIMNEADEYFMSFLLEKYIDEDIDVDSLLSMSFEELKRVIQ